MKFAVKVLPFLFTALCSIASASCENLPDVANTQKKYIKSHDVSIFNDQILVRLDGQWVHATELRSDENGLYLTKSVGLWYCKNCGWHNEDVPNCHQCGKPRPQKPKV